MSLEKLLLRKVELWLVALLAIGSAVCATSFGAVVLHTAHGGTAAGPLGPWCLAIAGFPALAKRVLVDEDTNDHRVESRFDVPAGFSDADGRRVDVRAQYLLLNRYDGDLGYSVAEFYRPDSTSPVVRWVFDDPDKFRAASVHRATPVQLSSDPATMRAVHAHLNAHAHLTVHFHGSPLYQLDGEANIRWANTDFDFHHSIQADHQGHLWIPAHKTPSFDGEVVNKPYVDDRLVRVGPDGTTEYAKSVTEILAAGGLENRIYAFEHSAPDPIHLNDIEPVLVDGPHWRTGDVFLSLGHLNLVLLYRPESDELVWWSQDDMMHQHDVNLVGDAVFVFDNNRRAGADGAEVRGANEVLRFDLGSGEIDSPYRARFEEHEIRTITQGLVDFGPDGSMLVEETNYGRLLLLGADGTVQWQYVNKDQHGTTWTLNWSRLVDAELGSAIVAALASEE